MMKQHPGNQFCPIELRNLRNFVTLKEKRVYVVRLLSKMTEKNLEILEH